MEYSLRANDSASHGLALQADTDADVARLYWFAGKTFLGATHAHEPLCWQPSPGTYSITALDDHGRSHSRTVTFALAEGRN